MDEATEYMHHEPAPRPAPVSTFEAITRVQLERLAKDVQALETRVDRLLWGCGGVIIADFAARFLFK